MGSGVSIDLFGIKMAGPSIIAWQNHGVDVFPVALFKRLSDHPPSHGGTERLNPSTLLPLRLTLHAYPASAQFDFRL